MAVADSEFEGFEPLRRAPRRKRVLVLLLGPLLWVATFVVVGFAVRSFNVVQIGLAVAVGSLLFALALLLIGRARRTRREE